LTTVIRTRHRRDIAISSAAQAIDTDLRSVDAALRTLEPVLADCDQYLINRDGRRPMAARLLVARDLRRTVFVAIAARITVALLPTAIDVLSGREPVPPIPASHLSGARGRVFHGSTATVAATIESVLAPARERMYARWTAAEREVVLAAVRRLSGEVSRWARATHTEEFGAAWTESARRRDPYRTGSDPGRPYRSRTLTFLADHLYPDLDASLRGSELGQAEHLAVGLSDLYQAFARAGCPTDVRLSTALAHLSLLSGLAALRDEVAERIVFEVGHAPLYRVAPVPGTADWTVTARRSPSTVQARSRPGRCPAVEILVPATATDRELLAAFSAELNRLTGGRYPATGTQPGISAADVSAAVASRVADGLFRQDGFETAPGSMTR
jgi:hypothetical protein